VCALCGHDARETRLAVLLRPPSSGSSKTNYFGDHIEAALGGVLPWSDGDPRHSNTPPLNPPPARRPPRLSRFPCGRNDARPSGA
jgi:hypothetical protein